MDLTDELKHYFKDEFEEYENYLKEALRTDYRLANIILNYIVTRRGKEIRPLLVFMISSLYNSRVSERAIRLAAMIEILHTATLVHDDIVDDADLRRGRFTVNALWKNKGAVLIGDYLLAKGLMLSIDSEEYGFLRMLSDVVKNMSEGELLQMEKSRFMNVDESLYYEIIRKKTALLFSLSMLAGGISVDCSNDELEKLKVTGEQIGIAFQIKDDLLDFGIGGKSGKNSYSDVKNSKLTLPLIKLIETSNFMKKIKIIKMVKFREVDELKKLIMENNYCLNYANEKMHYYKDSAIKGLEALNIKNEYMRDKMVELFNFLVNR